MATRDLKLDPPYCDVFEGILLFSSFAEAEATLLRLENLCHQYKSASDKKGMEYCRRIAALGRQRAELISRNHRVRREKRLQKQEIAAWFKVWLETPDIFADWLALRKNTEEFQKLLKLESGGELKSGERDASGSETA
jgi:hypothetical protein